jgi:hypothetical protein
MLALAQRRQVWTGLSQSNWPMMSWSDGCTMQSKAMARFPRRDLSPIRLGSIANIDERE